MKKILSLLIMGLLIFLFVGCSNEQNLESSNESHIKFAENPNFHSILDTQTNTILSLGDAKSLFDDTLGEGIPNQISDLESNEMYHSYWYDNETLSVLFIDNIAAKLILSEQGIQANRFEFKHLSSDITRRELDENFNIVFDDSELTIYRNYYDLEENSVLRENAMFYSEVGISDEGILSLTTGSQEVSSHFVCEACEERELDFKSILDTFTNNVLSLGDPKAWFDNVLGLGTYAHYASLEIVEDYQTYLYGDLMVIFIEDVAVEIVLFDAGRPNRQFKFKHMSLEMNEEEISRHFNYMPLGKQEDMDRHFNQFYYALGDFSIYRQYYSANGEVVQRDEASYYAVVSVSYWDGWKPWELTISSLI